MKNDYERFEDIFFRNAIGVPKESEGGVTGGVE